MISGSTEQEITLQESGLYLVRNTYYYTHTIHEMYVEKIAKSAYKFRIERTDGTWYIDWIDKVTFEERYVVDELLERRTYHPPVSSDKVKVEINNPDYLKALTTFCPVCNGTGRVPDPSATAGDQACPKCNGSGVIYAVE